MSQNAAMYYLLFEATPARVNPDADQVAGAFMNCWIQAANVQEAVTIAKRCLRENHWIVTEPEEARVVDRATYTDNACGLEYYEQALIDKTVFVIHCYPIDDEQMPPGRETE